MFSLLHFSNNLLVVAQASAGDNKSLVGWGIVLLLAAIFVAFVVSILRTKPIDAAAMAAEDAKISKSPVAADDKLESEDSVTVATSGESRKSTLSDSRNIASTAANSSASASPTATPKVKGLKGKKKQQKKKLNAQRGVSTTGATASSSTTKRDDDTVAQPRIAEYSASPSSTSIAADGSGSLASESSEATAEGTPAVEPVRLASTYAINAMANKPRSTSKPKESAEKKSQSKGAVQGFHKMDRFREPIRTVNVPIATPAAPRTDMQAASIGGESDGGRKDERRERTERRPGREPAKPVQAEAEGPRTLKDFLTQKPGEE
jgi:hypothetical protein